MGRHSAPDSSDAAEVLPISGHDTVAAVLSQARHAHPDSAPTEQTVSFGPTVVPASAVLPQAEEAEVSGGAAPPAAPASRAKSSDLRLLRGSRVLQWQCAGAVVLAFLIFTSVLVVLGRTDVYLVWVWIPTVVSGVAVGGLMDLAARSAARSSARSKPADGDQQESGPSA